MNINKYICDDNHNNLNVKLKNAPINYNLMSNLFEFISLMKKLSKRSTYPLILSSSPSFSLKPPQMVPHSQVLASGNNNWKNHSNGNPSVLS